MLIGIHELDCARTCFGESSGGFSTPSGIDLGGLIGVVDALKQNVSDDRATISVERENVSNQPCSVRCHKPSLPGRPLPHRASFAAARTGYGAVGLAAWAPFRSSSRWCSESDGSDVVVIPGGCLEMVGGEFLHGLGLVDFEDGILSVVVEDVEQAVGECDLSE